jgi:hypothetical protein
VKDAAKHPSHIQDMSLYLSQIIYPSTAKGTQKRDRYAKTALDSVDLFFFGMRFLWESWNARCSHGLTQVAHSWNGRQGHEMCGTLKENRIAELEGPEKTIWSNPLMLTDTKH